MAQNTLSNADSPRRRSGLLRDQVQLVKRSASSRYEIAPIQDQLSFEKGFFIVIRACQLLVQKNEGIVLVGVAGPSGAGKSMFTEKILNVMPSIAIINMDNYNEPSRIVDGNFDGGENATHDVWLDAHHEFRSYHRRYLMGEDGNVDLLCMAFQTMHWPFGDFSGYQKKMFQK